MAFWNRSRDCSQSMSSATEVEGRKLDLQRKPRSKSCDKVSNELATHKGLDYE
jgi:hypothetical protein